MTNYLKKFIIIFLSILIFIIIYLTFIGFNTDKFNNFFSNKLKNKNPDISLEFKKIKFYLEPLRLKLKVETFDPSLSIKKNYIKIKEINAKISLLSFLQRQNSIEQINVKSKDNKIKSLIKILRIYKNNFQTIILDKVVQNGEIIFEVDLELDKKGKLKHNFDIQGNVKKFEITFLNKNSEFKTDFDFIHSNKKTKILNGKIDYKGIKLISESIIISKSNNDLFLIKGNMKTNDANIDIMPITERLLGKSQLIENNKINLDSNSDFSFNINNRAKITNFNITSKSKIKKIILPIDGRFIQKVFQQDNKIEFNNQIINVNAKLKNFSKFKDANISIKGSGKFIIDGVADNINYSYKKDKHTQKINLLAKLDNNEFYLDELNFKKKKKQKSSLEMDFRINKDQSILINKIILKNNKNIFDISDVNISKYFKINNFKKIDFNFKNKNNKLNNISIIKNKKFYKISGEIFDGSKLIDNINNKKKVKTISSILMHQLKLN